MGSSDNGLPKQVLSIHMMQTAELIEKYKIKNNTHFNT